MALKKFNKRNILIFLVLIFIFVFVKSIQPQEVKEKIQMMQMEIEQKGYLFTVGMTSVSKIPLEKLCGLKEPVEWEKKGIYDKSMETISAEMVTEKIALPQSFDWRTYGKVTGVRDQGNCGSCWDFATIGSYEGAIAVFLNRSVNLSEQYILDCNSHNYNCMGGWWVFDDLKNGVPLETCYPYTAVKGSCKQTCPKFYPLENWYYVGGGGMPSIDAIKYAIYNYGPVAAAVYVNSYFHNYTGGIFNACTTGNVNHGVVLVGWNDIGGYWILKNSWGTNWGEMGYMRIKYECCKIGYAAAYGIPKTKFIQVAGVGWEGQGAGMAITNLDVNTKPDMILMAYDAPAGDNSFRYKIGWNLNTSGVTTSWSPTIQVPGVGWEGQGAGVAIVNLAGSARPEMILMAYDNPAGANSFRYKIGWDLKTSGVASSWSSMLQIPGVGWEGQGADIVICNLDTNPALEFIFMAYDNPAGANSFRYKILFNRR